MLIFLNIRAKYAYKLYAYNIKECIGIEQMYTCV